MIAGRAESRERNLRARRCTQRTFYRVAPIAAIARSHCARVGRGALVIGRPTCILTADCLRAHALRQAELVGATLSSTFSRARARACACIRANGPPRAVLSKVRSPRDCTPQISTMLTIRRQNAPPLFGTQVPHTNTTGATGGALDHFFVFPRLAQFVRPLNADTSRFLD